jgi:hypothetical protein
MSVREEKKKRKSRSSGFSPYISSEKPRGYNIDRSATRPPIQNINVSAGAIQGANRLQTVVEETDVTQQTHSTIIKGYTVSSNTWTSIGQIDAGQQLDNLAINFRGEFLFQYTDSVAETFESQNIIYIYWSHTAPEELTTLVTGFVADDSANKPVSFTSGSAYIIYSNRTDNSSSINLGSLSFVDPKKTVYLYVLTSNPYVDITVIKSDYIKQ